MKVIYSNTGQNISTYYSNRSWEGRRIYYDTPNMDGYYDATFTDPSGGIPFPESDIIQIPLYRDIHGKLFVKPNDTLEKSSDHSYVQGKYTLEISWIIFWYSLFS